MSCLRKQCLCLRFSFSPNSKLEKKILWLFGVALLSPLFSFIPHWGFSLFILSSHCTFLAPKACVEIDTVRGAWRDVSCGEYRPFICKRKMGEFKFVTRWKHFTKRMRKTETSSFQCARINLVFHRVRITHDFWVCSDLCWNGVLMVLYEFFWYWSLYSNIRIWATAHLPLP